MKKSRYRPNRMPPSLRPFTMHIFLCLLMALVSCDRTSDENAGLRRNALSAKEDEASRKDGLIAAMSMYQFTNAVKAPDIDLETVNRGRASLSQYRGSVVLLNFWTTW